MGPSNHLERHWAQQTHWETLMGLLKHLVYHWGQQTHLGLPRVMMTDSGPLMVPQTH